jgi:hypothetical protein
MTFLMASTIWGITALAGAAIAGVLASIKNRDYSVWMGWGFLFPPIVIYFALVSRRKGPRPRQPTLDELTRQQHDQF